MRQSIIEIDIKELGAIILNYAGNIIVCRSPVYVYASIYLQHSVLQFLKTTEFAWRIHSFDNNSCSGQKLKVASQLPSDL